MLPFIRYGRIRPYLRYQSASLFEGVADLPSLSIHIWIASYTIDIACLHEIFQQERFWYIPLCLCGMLKLFYAVVGGITVHKNRAQRAFDVDNHYYLRKSEDYTMELKHVVLFLLIAFPVWIPCIIVWCYESPFTLKQAYQLVKEDYRQWTQPATMNNEYLAAQYLRQHTLESNFMLLAKEMKWGPLETVRMYYQASVEHSEAEIYL